MNIIRFSVAGVPVAKGRARYRHVKTRAGREFNTAYTPKKTADAEETFVARSLAFAPSTPFAGALRLSLVFVLPIPASLSKPKRAAIVDGSTPHVKRPDLDNLEKLIKDACNGVFWIDDSQIFEVSKRKVYGAVPRTDVTIEEIQGGF
jgi:Holliday junction resolvase RusA-like endonuclease